MTVALPELVNPERMVIQLLDVAGNQLQPPGAVAATATVPVTAPAPWLALSGER